MPAGFPPRMRLRFASGVVAFFAALWLALLGILVAAIWAVAYAAAPTCQLSLTLLTDMSASVKSEQRKLMREGVAWALANPVLEPGDPVKHGAVLVEIAE